MTLINDTQLNSDKVQPLQYGEKSITCPCCDHILYSTTNLIGFVNFDYWKGVIFQGDKQVRLQPQEADLLKILLDNWPKLCSREKLLVGLYGGNYSERVNIISSDNIGVVMSKLRSKLKIFHIKIQNTSKRGWQLVSETKLTGVSALVR